MSERHARAWWADVEHLRERIERRRELERAGAGARFARPEALPDRVPDPDAPETDSETDWNELAPQADDLTPLRDQVISGPDVRSRRFVREEADAPGFTARRTVRIRGQAIPTVVAPRLRPVEDLATEADEPDLGHRRPQANRRRRRGAPAARVGARPDRIALWAFALGLLLVLVAALSARGATLPPPPAHPQAPPALVIAGR